MNAVKENTEGHINLPTKHDNDREREALPKPVLRRTESYGLAMPKRTANGVTFMMVASYTGDFCFKQFGTDWTYRECTKEDLVAWYDSLPKDSPHRESLRWEISKIGFGKKTRAVLRRKWAFASAALTTAALPPPLLRQTTESWKNVRA